MASEATEQDVTASDHRAFTVIAGDCRIERDVEEHQTYRGQVLVVIKPDDTVLIHDIEGYQPVAWLTRAERVTVDTGDGTVTAVDGDRWLRVRVLSSLLDREFPGTSVGSPVGDCPTCGGCLVEDGAAVHCVGCRTRYGLPDGATVLETTCGCGLPQMRIDRGDRFELCIDRACEPMEEALADRFDVTWACPAEACNGELRVVRRPNLLLACDAYPDCEVAFSFPTGLVDGHCGCGLPRFTTGDGSRCLDDACEAGA